MNASDHVANELKNINESGHSISCKTAPEKNSDQPAHGLSKSSRSA